MEKLTTQQKREKLESYLASNEHTRILLLDMLRCKELSQQEYNRMIDDTDKAYKKFLTDLRKPPIDESQIPIPFEKEED